MTHTATPYNQSSIDDIETKLAKNILTSCCAVANTAVANIRNTARYSVSPRRGKTLHVFKMSSTVANLSACKSAVEQLHFHGAIGWELFSGTSKTGNVVGIKKIS